MKPRHVVICILVMAALSALSALALDQNDIDEHRSCTRCGMDRKSYGYSRMLIRYQDDGQTGICSLHCAVVEVDANKGRAVKSILVADLDTRILIDADKAFWVMGGKKRGVMTQLPKWAFGTEAAASSFIASHGGTVASWAEAQAAAREENIHKSH